MRALLFSNSYKPTVSGVVTSISLFRQGLQALGHQVFLFAPEYRDYEDPEPFVFRFPSVDLPESVDLSVVMPIHALMWPTVQGLKPDLIHSQHPILMGGLGADFADELQIPLVFTFHSRYDQYARKYVPLVSGLATSVTEEAVRRYLIRCSHIIAPTASVKAIIEDDYHVGVPITVVPTPVELSRYRDLHPDELRERLQLQSAEILLYIGRLAEEKNLEFLLRAFARIVRSRPQTRLVLVGGGPKEKGLRRLTGELELGERVIFAGAVPHESVPGYAAAADLFVFPSTSETQGLVMIEAMAAGTPVVAVDAPGTSDILADGGGRLVPLEEGQFAQKVLNLLADEDGRRSLEAEALRVAETYTVDSATERLLDVYRQALADGPRLETRRQADERGLLETVKSALTKPQEDSKADHKPPAELLDKIRTLASGSLALELMDWLLVEEIEELARRARVRAEAYERSMRKIRLNYEDQRASLAETLSDLWSLGRALRNENRQSDVQAADE
jgi:glycosyltransferase involved in cell wall biosynthesis